MATPTLDSSELTTLRDVLQLAHPDGFAPAGQPHSRTSAGGTGPHPNPAAESTSEVMRLLLGIVSADVVAFQAMDSSDFHTLHYQEVEADETFVRSPEEMQDHPPGFEVFKAHYWLGPCSLTERRGVAAVYSSSSWFGEREWREHPVNREFHKCVDIMSIAYPAGPFRSQKLMFFRDVGAAFEERDLLILRLLQPHLHALLSRTAAAGAHSIEPWPLTARQLEILHLARLGMPNKSIARVLRIAEATVRKHLENAYQRLGVQSRTAAVVRAFGGDEEAVRPEWPDRLSSWGK